MTNSENWIFAALDEANVITMREMMQEEMEKTRSVAKDQGTITIPAKNLPRYAVCEGCGEYERVDYWYGGIVPYCRDCCKGIIN